MSAGAPGEKVSLEVSSLNVMTAAKTESSAYCD